jgi:hypothetical protein
MIKLLFKDTGQEVLKAYFSNLFDDFNYIFFQNFSNIINYNFMKILLNFKFKEQKSFFYNKNYYNKII